MAHVLILGITSTGKTTLAFKLAKIYKSRLSMQRNILKEELNVKNNGNVQTKNSSG